MECKLIVSDLDKTLLRDDKSCSAYTGRTIESINTPFTIATARPYRCTRGYIYLLNPYAVIANNGSTIFVEDKQILNIFIKNSILQSLSNEFLCSPSVTGITMETGTKLLTNTPTDIFPPEWNAVFCDFSTMPDEQICKLSVECNDNRYMSHIMSQYPGLNLYSNANESWWKITSEESTKENAIKHIANMMKIDMDEIIAFGDDENDTAMLRQCGRGIAVAKAIPAALAAADEICGDNDSDGVARWLAAYFNID